MKISTLRKALIVLALMIAVAVPVCAMSGSGTSSDPYTVANLADLKMVANNPAAYYQQTADIVINDPSLFEFENRVIAAANGAEEWTPIENFTGTYDGNNKYITGLYVTDENANGGLFAEINGGTVKSLNMDFALVESDEYAGVLAGKVDGTATVELCTSSGSVIGKTTKSMNTAGGLVGFVGKNATVKTSASYATVTGATSYSANVGGLVGINHGTITGCGYLGNVFGTATYYDAAIGGIAGYNTGDIDNCRNAGVIAGESTAKVNDCYVGGIAGVNKGYIEYCENDDNSTVSVYNYSASKDDSVLCAAGGIVGMTVDAAVTCSTNNGAVSGEYSYCGGIAGVAISDTGVFYIDYNDNTGAVNCVGGVAGGIVGRAVAAGEGYVSIKLYIDDCYNSGAVTGIAYGAMAGETATVDDASVTIYEGSSSNANTCSARGLFKTNTDAVQYGSKISAKGEKISGGGSLAATRFKGYDTEKSDKKIVRYSATSTTAFLPAPAYVELVVVKDASKVEALDLDVSGLKYADGRITGNVVVKVYRPSGDTTAYQVVVGTSVGNKFADADFATVTGTDRVTFVTVPVDCEAEAGTININALVVGTTDVMDPVCENVEVSK